MHKRRLLLDRDDLERTYNRLLSLKETAAHYGVSRQTVHQRMKDFDIPRQPRGGALGNVSCNHLKRWVDMLARDEVDKVLDEMSTILVDRAEKGLYRP